jgi:hypothetical protein
MSNNPSAFPRVAASCMEYSDLGSEGADPQSGMSLRDYFAGQALVGYLANPNGDYPPASDIVGYCYDVADWMLKERTKVKL